MRVLLAEDHQQTRRLLQQALQRMGHDCSAVDDGLAAWTAYQEHGADVVLSDWLMPGISGPELCRRVRQASGARYTYFILVTALDDTAHLLQGMQAGADDYLTKPVALAELRARLVAAERVTRLHRQLAEREARQEALLRVARSFAEGGKPDQVLRMLLVEAVTLLRVQSGQVFLWDNDRRQLALSQCVGPSTTEGKARQSANAAAEAAMRGAPVIRTGLRALPASAEADGQAAQAALAVPLRHQGRVLGALAVSDADLDRNFTRDDAESLELLANTASAVLLTLEQSRIEGVLITARTARHEANNRLTVTAGFAEELALDDTLPEYARELARDALVSARAAADVLASLEQLTRLEERHMGPHVGTMIDLEKSLR